MIDFCQQTGHRPTVLHLVHRVPYPPDKGDRIRTFQFLRYLAERADVHLACLADEPTAARELETLERYCRRVAVVNVQGPGRWLRALKSLALGGTVTEGAFQSAELRATVRRWARATRFDVVLASASSMAPYLSVPELADVPAVVDLIDVDSQKWYDYAASRRGPKSWLYRLEGRRLRHVERQLSVRAKALTLVSAAEVGLFRRFCAEGRVEAIGNGVDLDYFQPRRCATEAGCVFLGALDYWPNVEGICWFCREVWPQVRARHAQATLTLVGRRPAPAVCRLAKVAGVRLVGQVPDVRPHLAAASVSVVPLSIARGVQNKVLEAMAMAKATVVSPQALEGLHAEPGVHLLTASAPAEWVEAIVGLLEDPERGAALASAGRSYVEQTHRWDVCLKPLDRLLDLPAHSRLAETGCY